MELVKMLSRLRYALRWAIRGSSTHQNGPVTVVCSHAQPGDLMVMMSTFRGITAIDSRVAGDESDWTRVSSVPTPTVTSTHGSTVLLGADLPSYVAGGSLGPTQIAALAQERFQLDPEFHARCLLVDRIFQSDAADRYISVSDDQVAAARHAVSIALYLAESDGFKPVGMG